jgi:hypothetical protein|uniref:Uncharacterized protein n=1 Tax=viral metagenome TaxID=1070528 RepID=A0A6C0JNK1_9ZZZZ
MENDLSNCFSKLSVNNKNCVICYNNYVVNFDYSNCDVLCIMCSNNYNQFMLEENNDYVDIL